MGFVSIFFFVFLNFVCNSYSSFPMKVLIIKRKEKGSMDTVYNSRKTVPSAVSACSKEVRDVQTKIRDALATSSTITETEKELFNNLLDNLSEAIDDQMVLSIENINRIRKSEATAIKHAKDMRTKMQKIVDYCEQQTGAKVDPSLFDYEEGTRLPPNRRRRQVTVLGMDLDRIEVDDTTSQPIRSHYTSHGKYSSSEDEGEEQAENDNASDQGSIRRTFSTDSRDSRRSGSGVRRRTMRSSIRSGSRKSSLVSTQPISSLNDKLFSITKSTESSKPIASSSASGGGASYGTSRDKFDADGKRSERKNAGDRILDQLATKGTVVSSPVRSQYTSKIASGPDRLTLEGLSCFLYSLLQSTSHFLQAERARLYIPHQENKIMKVVCAVPDASIVCYRGGQYVAAHQGLPGAAMATGVAISVDKVNDDIRRNYLSTTLHGGGSLAAEEQQRGDKKGDGAETDEAKSGTHNKRSGTVESILVFPIRHSLDPSKVVGVFEFINKVHLQPWTEHDEQLCFTASRLASYWLSTYETLLDLHQMPAFQPQESYFLAAPYRPAGYTAALAKYNLSHIGKHMLPLFIARVTELDDMPSKKGGESENLVQPAGQVDDTGAPTSPSAAHHERIKEVGAIRYVRELTAYLRELERSSRTNVSEIVQTRDAQAKQIEEIIKQKSKVKALEDNNTYLRDKLLETQKKLSVYMNQLHGNASSPLLAGPDKSKTKQSLNVEAGHSNTKRLGSEPSNATGSSHLPPLLLTSAATPSRKPQRNKNVFEPTGSPQNNLNVSAKSQILAPNHSSRFSPLSKTNGRSDEDPLFTRAPPSLATLKDFLFEAQLSVNQLKTQALMSAPPSTSASLYNALTYSPTRSVSPQPHRNIQKKINERSQTSLR